MSATRSDRIAARFAELRLEKRAAFIPFLEACEETSLAMRRGLPAAGADVIEIGVPFTDPAADGPTIQRAGLRALKAGGTLERALAMVHTFREDDAQTPIILMGYMNPILAYGAAQFCIDARRSGVDGVIVVDMPPEESEELLPSLEANELDLIRLVAPTTTDARLPYVLQQASGFVYYVAIAGITGTHSALIEDLANAIPRVRRCTSLPIAIGFGVRTPDQASQVAQIADGVVVASALIEILACSLDEQGRAQPETIPGVLQHIRDLAIAVKDVPKTT